MAWRCGRCDGIDVPFHHRTCLHRDEDQDEDVTVVDGDSIHVLRLGDEQPSRNDG